MKKTLSLILALLMLLPLVLASCAAEPEETFDDVFTADKMIKNAALWNGKRLADDRCQFIIEYFNDKVKDDGLGVSYNYFGGDFLHTDYAAGEWGNAYINLDGRMDGAGLLISSPFGKDGHPTDEADQVSMIREFLTDWLSRRTDEDKLPATSMNGIFPWPHYAGSVGYENLGVEFIYASNQFRMAMVRGAAKQYDTTWFTDYSPWYCDTVYSPVDENGEKIVGDTAVAGYSMNIMERSFLMSVMGGADAVIAEGGESRVYYPDGELSPYGEICKRINTFIRNNDLGTAYTPVAVIIGTDAGVDSLTRHFGAFENTPADTYTYNIFDKVLWGCSLFSDTHQEAKNMVDGKYGELFDIFLQDVSAELIETYPALLLAGDPDLTADELNKYIEYVGNGGILVLNTAQVGIFADKVKLPSEITSERYEEITYGKGSFFVFGKGGQNEQFDPIRYLGVAKKDLDSVKDTLPDIYNSYLDSANVAAGDWSVANLSSVLDEIYSRFVPFTFSDDIGYSISVSDGRLLLYVFNNDGVSKAYQGRPIYDESLAKDFAITYTGAYTLRSAQDIYNGHEIKTDGKTMQIHLGAGDMAVIELLIGKE